MSGRPQDPELRERFARLRREDAARAPSFARMLAEAKAGHEPAGSPARRLPLARHWRRFGWAGGLAAAAALVLLLANPRSRSSELAFERAVRSFQTDPALGAWRSPTDVLLDVPGSRLISTVPAIDAVRPAGPRSR